MEKQFIYMAATLLLILGLLDLGRSYIFKDKTDYTTGEIVSFWQPNPEAVKKGNSKWADFKYTISGKNYKSSNMIQVPLSTKIGDKRKIKYNKENPEKIYNFSIKRALVLCIISIVLFIIGKFDLA